MGEPEDDRDRETVAALHLHGVLPPRPRLAIVGARAAHRRYRDLVPVIVGALAPAGWSLVSGGALGIDGDAHRAALEAGVAQVAVLPCGEDRPYPPAHRELFARLLGHHASGVLYTQPVGRQPAKAMFVSRNRHVVALADAVVVVEAERPSGTLHTGRLALKKGIGVAAITGSRGASDLIGRGAVSLPAEPAMLAEAVGPWLRDPGSQTVTWPLHLLWIRDAIEAAGTAGMRLDRAPDPVAAAVALTDAELLGLVVEVRPGTWNAAAKR